MSNTNFLSQVLSLGLNWFSFEVIKTETKVTVIFSPKTKSTDPAVKNLKPLHITFDSVEEMEQKLFETISKPISMTSELFNGMEAYEASLAELNKNKKEAKDTKATPADKKETATEKKKREAEEKKAEAEKVAPTLSFDEDVKESELEVDKEHSKTSVPISHQEPKEQAKTAPEMLKQKVEEIKNETVEDAKVIEEMIIDEIPPVETNASKPIEVPKPIQEEKPTAPASLFNFDDDDDMPDFLK